MSIMPVALSILLLSVTTPAAFAANSSTTATVGWVSGPTGRGTFSIICSCLLTLGSCVWSAMHLNIPPHDERPTQAWMRYMKWCFVGVVAPELVLFAAWRQHNSAKALHAEVQRYLNTQHTTLLDGGKGEDESKGGLRASGSGRIEQIYPWTMMHSFYAGMGGFIAEPDASPANGGLSERLTLSARGIALLARCGHLPNIDKDQIADKNKADGLAKSLVCVQAGWMVVQVTARVALGLPVTLLEVNTLGHVLCALIIYVLWWDKPRAVREATKLEGDWVNPICAYMYMSSRVSGRRSSHAGTIRRTWISPAGILRRPSIDPELKSLAFFIPQVQSVFKSTTEEKLAIGNGQQYDSTQESIDFTSQSCDVSGEVREDTMDLGYFGPRPVPSFPTKSFAFSGVVEQAQSPSTMQPTRWHLAADAVRMYPAIRQRFTPSPSVKARKDDPSWLEPVSEELLTKSIANWPGQDLLVGTGGLVMGMVLWFASMAYGGVHMAAWNDYFPSAVEAWIWRSSSIYITASGFLWMMIHLLAKLSKSLDAYWDSILALQAHWTSYVIFGSLCFVCGVLYIFARMFLVVESFISIRQLPVLAYGTPVWTQLIPHL